MLNTKMKIIQAQQKNQGKQFKNTNICNLELFSDLQVESIIIQFPYS